MLFVGRNQTQIIAAAILIGIAWPSISKPLVFAQSAISGIVTKVLDGDTIEVRRTPIRLNGLHAPELRHRGGRAAKRFMVRLVLNKRVTCRLSGERTYDRLVGSCFLNGRDIARSLIRAGLGRDCPRYSGGRYAADEPPSVKSMRLPRYCTRK